MRLAAGRSSGGCLVALAFLILLGIGTAVLVATRKGATRPISVQDVHEVESEAKRRPQEPGPQVDVVIAYAAVLGQFGDLRRSLRGVRDMLESDPQFASKPEVQAKRAKMDQSFLNVANQVGIRSEREWNDFLERGLAAGDRALTRTDLSPEQRATAHLARGRLQLQCGRPKDALKDAGEAAKHQGDPVLIALLRADAHQDLGAWSAAINELRAASLALASWVDERPGWGMRLLAAMGGRRSWRAERNWRERKAEAARKIQMSIRDQVSVLRGLEQLSQRSQGSE